MLEKDCGCHRNKTVKTKGKFQYKIEFRNFVIFLVYQSTAKIIVIVVVIVVGEHAVLRTKCFFYI